MKIFPSKTSLVKEVAVPANRSCAFYYGDKFFVQYLDCEGSWKLITAQNVLNTIEVTPSWSTTVLKIRVSVVCEMTKEQAIIYRRRGFANECFLR